MASALIEKTVERSEHDARVLALQKCSGIGMVAWPAFGLADWFIVELIEPGRLWVYWLTRMIGMGILVAGFFLLRRKPALSPDAVLTVDASAGK